MGAPHLVQESFLAPIPFFILLLSLPLPFWYNCSGLEHSFSAEDPQLAPFFFSKEVLWNGLV